MKYGADLWFNDHTLTIKLNRQELVSPDEVAAAERVLDSRDGHLVLVR